MNNKKPNIAQELHDATKQLSDAIKNTFTNPIEFGTGKNEKLVLSKIMIDGVIHEIDINKIIKLNEELTAENIRLISKLEKIDKERSIWHNYYNDLSANNKSLTNQLQTIKSKWWYKLMTWGW